MAVDLNPGDNWQAKIDANQSADELFIGKSGTHLQQTANIRPGQTLLMEDGCICNGQFAVSTFFNGMTNNAHGAEIGSLFAGGPDPPQIHSYAPGFQQSVFKLRNNEVATVRDVLLHGFILRDSYSGVSQENGWGVDMGERTYLLRLDISGMGQAGVSWSGKVTAFQTPETAGGTIDDCDLHDNGNAGSDAGGISKMAGGPGSRGRILKNSRIWGNRRSNVWCDFLGRTNDGSGQGQHGQWITSGVLEIVNCDLFEVGAGTLSEALFLEVSAGVFLHHSRIYTNQSTGGGGLDGAQVICHNAAYNIIEDNIFYDNGTRVFGVNQSARYDASGRLITCEGNAFRRNKVYAIDTAVTFLTGLSQLGAGAPYQLIEGGGGGTWDARTQGNNIWEDNEYFVLDTLHSNTSGALFRLDEGFGSINFAAWQAAGFDVDGTYQVLTAGELPSEVPEFASGITPGGRRGRRTTPKVKYSPRRWR